METYLVISRVASILASLVAALVAPNLYFYASAAAPFTLCACVCIMLAAVVGSMFLADVVALANENPYTLGFRSPDWGAIRRPTPRCRDRGRSF